MSKQDDDESREPGVTLGRLMAAERNALSALNTVKSLHSNLSEKDKKIQQLESEVAQLKGQLNGFNTRLAMVQGRGPTT